MKYFLLVSVSLIIACHRSDLVESGIVNHDWTYKGSRCSSSPEINTSSAETLGLKKHTVRFRGFEFTENWNFKSLEKSCDVSAKGRFKIDGDTITLTYQEVSGLPEAAENCAIRTSLKKDAVKQFKFNRSGQRLEMKKPITVETASATCQQGEYNVEVFE